jgi:hypothetical protein
VYLNGFGGGGRDKLVKPPVNEAAYLKKEIPNGLFVFNRR